MSGSPIIDSILAELEAEGRIPKNRREAIVGQRLPHRCRRGKRGSYKKKGDKNVE